MNWFRELRNNQEWYRDQYIVILAWLPLMIAVITTVTVYLMITIGEALSK